MDKANEVPKKRGRKPIGERAMTPAEAKRRSREKMRAAGAKDYLMTVGPHHLTSIKHLAEKHGISEASALFMVLDNALDYFTSVMACHDGMLLIGMPQDECSRFVLDHWPLSAPPMPDKLARAIEAA